MNKPLITNMMAVWIEAMKHIIESIKQNGPYQLHVATRIFAWITFPVCCCAPCVVWSCMWRMIACPCQCMCKGAGHACSNNGCTEPTDYCLSSCIHSIEEHHETLMNVPIKNHVINEAQLQELKVIVDGLVRDLEDPQTKHKDCLVSMAVKPFMCLLSDASASASASASEVKVAVENLKRVNKVLDTMIGRIATPMSVPEQVQVGTKL